MGTTKRQIHTIRVTTIGYGGKPEIEFYAGRDIGKRNSTNLMEFSSSAQAAQNIHYSSPEEEFKLLEEARDRKNYVRDRGPIVAEFVNLEITITDWSEPVEPSEEYLNLLKQKLLRKMSPTEIKALGLQTQAVYLKLADG